jgi:hypothetical protein
VVSNTAPYNTPNYLTNSVLLGSGVSAAGITFNGDPMQIGFFDGTATNLGVDSGLVLTTGSIQQLVTGVMGAPNSTATDPDLLTVANSVPPLIGQSFTVSGLHDIAVLEFDFVPTSDTLLFNYIFGSDEYLQWVNTKYNDVFGFFLSGPGITGSYSSPPGFPNGSINIAVVPGSNPELPITVSSVNNVLNNQFYFHNQNVTPQTVDCNGFTTLFTASASVECGETYHIRLAIADGSDDDLSSFVFLEANSFTSPTLTIENSLSIDTTNMLFIPCDTTVTLTAISNSGATFLWNTGSSDSSITVSAGDYWVYGVDTANCSLVSDTVSVLQPTPPTLPSPASQTICEGDIPVDIAADTVFNPSYTYAWSPSTYLSTPNAYSTSFSASPASSLTYYIDVMDTNNCIAQDSLYITVVPMPTINASADQQICYGGMPDTISVDTLAGATYAWSPPLNLVDPDSAQTAFSSGLTSTTTFVVTVNSAPCVIQDSLVVVVDPLPTVDLQLTPDSLCEGDTLQLQAVSSVAGLYQFQELQGGLWVDMTVPAFDSNNVISLASMITSTSYNVNFMVNGNNCQLVNDSASVIVNNLPVPIIIHY